MVLERETSVTAYKNDREEDKALMNTAIGDSSGAVKCAVYDSTKFPRFIEGQCLILRNAIEMLEQIAVTFEFIAVLCHMQRYFSHICVGTDVQTD